MAANKNYYTEITVSGVGAFPTTAQAFTNIRGGTSLMLVCTSGTDVEYSFNGTTLHGKISSGQTFTFENRNTAKMWVRGTGTIRLHAWAV